MDPERRAMLVAGAAGAAALVTGCSNSGDRGGGGAGDAGAAAESSAEGSAAPSAPGNAGVGKELSARSGIPVGGGKVFPAERVVVTQPSAGEFRAFSAVCTHQQCLVDKVAGGTIDCSCHGTRFKIADGSVEQGPATLPLPPRDITVTADAILLK
jgi:Rieske Fe-S protein